jgi:hypothetical protein
VKKKFENNLHLAVVSPSLAQDALEFVLDPTRSRLFGFKFGFGFKLSSDSSEVSGFFFDSSFRMQMIKSRSCRAGPALWLRFLEFKFLIHFF